MSGVGCRWSWADAGYCLAICLVAGPLLPLASAVAFLVSAYRYHERDQR